MTLFNTENLNYVKDKKEIYNFFGNKKIMDFLSISNIFNFEPFNNKKIKIDDIEFDIFIQKHILDNSSRRIILKNTDFLFELYFSKNNNIHFELQKFFQEQPNSITTLEIVMINNKLSVLDRKYKINLEKEKHYPEIKVDINGLIFIENSYIKLNKNKNLFFKDIQQDSNEIKKYLQPISYSDLEKKQKEQLKNLLNKCNNKNVIDILNNHLKNFNTKDLNIENLSFFITSEEMKYSYFKEKKVALVKGKNIFIEGLKGNFKSIVFSNDKTIIKLEISDTNNNTYMYINERNFDYNKDLFIKNYDVDKNKILLQNNAYNSKSYEIIDSMYDLGETVSINEDLEKLNEHLLADDFGLKTYKQYLFNIFLEKGLITLNDVFKNDFTIKKETLDLLPLLYDVKEKNVNHIKKNLSIYEPNVKLLIS